MPYNNTEYPWDKVKAHLQDLTNNSSLDINLLKQQVANFQIKVPKELYSTQFYDTLTKTLLSLDPRAWLSGSNIFIYLLITPLFLSLLIGYRCLYSRIHASHNGVQLAAAMLKLKTKGGYVGKRSTQSRVLLALCHFPKDFLLLQLFCTTLPNISSFCF